MSLFGAMNTAISGLSAQSAAFGNIGDKVANSQTVGFKRVDTSFQGLSDDEQCDDERAGGGGGAAELREHGAGDGDADG